MSAIKINGVGWVDRRVAIQAGQAVTFGRLVGIGRNPRGRRSPEIAALNARQGFHAKRCSDVGGGLAGTQNPAAGPGRREQLKVDCQ